MTEAKTFLDVFSPPKGTVGHTAVLVAMSAGEEFLDAAMERFTRLRARQRAALGLPQAWLMLDPHASANCLAVLPPGRVPGLHELHPRQVPHDSLLHAKLALLSFGPTRRGDATRVRLVVSTGNFTDASARHQLELLWVLDVALDASAPSDDRDDVAAAADFAQHLLDTRYCAEPAKTGPGAAGWMSGLRDLLTTARARSAVRLRASSTPGVKRSSGRFNVASRAVFGSRATSCCAAPGPTSEQRHSPDRSPRS